jgi:hypothetical protein
MLSERYAARLANLLLPLDRYHPFPTAAERAPWQALPQETRAALIAAGEEHLGAEWPALPATLYMEFARTGNRSHYEGPHFARRNMLAALVLAECAEGEGRFLDDIANGIWAICEESSWVIPAHNQSGDALADVQDPWVDLFASDTATALTYTHYLLRPQLDAVSPLLSRCIRDEVEARLLDPFLSRDDMWWMGRGERQHLNNWSPWCASNCLVASLLLAADAGRRVEAVAKAIDIVDRWLATYHDDGGCDEGPSYWGVAGGALFDCLELLYSATEGQIDVYDQHLIQQIGRYIYRAHISGGYYVDFADCPAKVHIDGGLVYRYGRRIGDPSMAALGAWAHQQRGGGPQRRARLLRALPALFEAHGIEEPAQPPYPREAWLDGIQVMAAREQGSSDRGFYLAAKGGHNAESHNHNDVGQFIVYYNGEPVLIDAGVGTYTRQTFSAQRYEIWTMQSAYHNLPTVKGVQQGVGREFAARGVTCHLEDAAAELSLELAGAYPAEAGISSWRRTCRLRRGEDPGVEITEEFLLGMPSPVTLSLLTPCPPEQTEEGQIALPAGDQRLLLSFDRPLMAEIERIALDDDRLRGLWGESLYRILLAPEQPVEEGLWVVQVTTQ